MSYSQFGFVTRERNLAIFCRMISIKIIQMKVSSLAELRDDFSKCELYDSTKLMENEKK